MKNKDSSSSSSSSSSENNKLKLFEFEFRTVFENKLCFPVFLDQAIHDLNSDIVVTFTHIEWFHALTPERMDLFEKLIGLAAAKCSSSVELSEFKIRILQEEFSRLGIQNHRTVTTLGLGAEHNNHNNSNGGNSPTPSSPIPSPASPNRNGSGNRLWGKSSRGTLTVVAPNSNHNSSPSPTLSSSSSFNNNHNHSNHNNNSGSNSPVSPVSPTSIQKAQEQMLSMSMDEQNMVQVCRMCELYAHCASLIETFLSIGAKHEVNISNVIRKDLMDRWTSFTELYRRSVEALIKQTSHYQALTLESQEKLLFASQTTKPLLTTTTTTTTITTTEQVLCHSVLGLKRHCMLVFKNCRLALEMTLADDIFPRFKRCKQWERFVQACSMDEVSQFGDCKAIVFIEPLRLSREDMMRPMITPKDVALARVLLKDFYHWKPMMQKKLAVYYSDIRFMHMDALQQYGNLNAYKSSFEYNCSAKDFLHFFLSQQYYSAISEMDVDFVTYIPMAMMNKRENNQSDSDSSSTDDASDDKSSPPSLKLQSAMNRTNTAAYDYHKRIINYGSTILYQKKLTTLVKREFVQTSTVFYEPSNRTYYYVYKYCEHKDIPEEKKGLVRGISYGVSAFTEIGGKCRFDNVFMVNMKGLMSSKSEKPGLLARKSILFHMKTVTKRTEEYVEEARKVNFKLSDGFHLLRPLGEFLAEFNIESEK